VDWSVGESQRLVELVMDFSVFEICFVLGFVGIGIARGYAANVEASLDKVLKVIVHNIPEKKWMGMCKKWSDEND